MNFQSAKKCLVSLPYVKYIRKFDYAQKQFADKFKTAKNICFLVTLFFDHLP